MFSTYNRFEISVSISLLLQNLALLVESVSLCSLHIIALKLVRQFRLQNLALLVESASLCSLHIIALKLVRQFRLQNLALLVKVFRFVLYI